MAKQIIEQELNEEQINQLISSTWDLFDLSVDEIDLIDSYKKHGDLDWLSKQIGRLISSRASLGWSTIDHSGVDVNL